MPFLNVDEEEFKEAAADATTPPHKRTTRLSKWGRFERFTDHLLIRRQIRVDLLDSFRLHVGSPGWGNEAARWLRHMVKYGAQLREPWNLKKLHVSNVTLDDRLAEHIRSRCPFLTEMHLSGCKCEFQEISSGSLERLLMEGCSSRQFVAITAPKLRSLIVHSLDRGRLTGNRPLVVSAPALAYLGISLPDCEGGLHLNEMPSLVHAFIDMCGNTVTALPEGTPGIDYQKLLDSVSGATTLKLARLLADQETMTTFLDLENLRSLSVDQSKFAGNFATLQGHLFQTPSNLEKFTLTCSKFVKRTNGSSSSSDKSNKASSFKRPDMVDVHVEELRLTDIYKEDVHVCQVVELASVRRLGSTK